MSDTTAKQAPLLTQEVERNSVKLAHTSHEITRGDYKGQQYLSPDINEDNLDTAVSWIGRKMVAKKLNGLMKQYGQGWWDEAVEQATDATTKVLDPEKAYQVYNVLACEFSARGESIKDLNEQIAELVDQMTNLDTTAPDFGAKFQEISTEVRELKVAIASKKRKPKEDKTAEASK